MSNTSHRKTEVDGIKIGIPWGHVLVVVALIVALFGALMLAASLTSPAAAASTSYLRPAVTATGTVGALRVSAATADRGYTDKAHRVTQWQRVLKRCHKIGCVSHVPAAMRRDMGIKPGQAYRVHWGDTTFIWVKLPGGRVRTITS